MWGLHTETGNSHRRANSSRTWGDTDDAMWIRKRFPSFLLGKQEFCGNLTYFWICPINSADSFSTILYYLLTWQTQNWSCCQQECPSEAPTQAVKPFPEILCDFILPLAASGCLSLSALSNTAWPQFLSQLILCSWSGSLRIPSS